MNDPTQAPSKEKVPGPQDPRPAGCRCGDMPNPRCPVHLGKWPRPRSECTHTPQGALSLFNTMQRSGECLLCERDSLRGELEAAEQHVRILQEQRAAHEPGASQSEITVFAFNQLKKRIADLERALHELLRGYVSTLETARERILFYGGQCDDVPTMERGDPHLLKARATLTK